MKSLNRFAEIITKHPQADIPIKGVKSHLVQAEEQQFIFMYFEHDVIIPAHSHAAQWGVVLSGTMNLHIDGTVQTLKKGDTYYIGNDVRHSVTIKKGYSDLTLFDQRDRYKIKSQHENQ